MKTRIAIAVISAAVLAVIGIAAWHILPRVMPEFSMRYSPFVDPVIRSAVYGGQKQEFQTIIACDAKKWNPIVIERMNNSSDRKIRAFLAEIVNQKVAQKLIVANDDLHKALVMGLADDEETVRFYAAAALGNLKYSAARERLESAMLDGSPSVRETVVWALGEIAHRRSLSALLSHLDDKDQSVRCAIIDALVLVAQQPISEEERREVILRIEALQKDESAHVNGRAEVAVRLLQSAPKAVCP